MNVEKQILVGQFKQWNYSVHTKYITPRRCRLDLKYILSIEELAREITITAVDSEITEGKVESLINNLNNILELGNWMIATEFARKVINKIDVYSVGSTKSDVIL
ncbi:MULTISPECIES: hypothetical protein [Sporosarcina]|uniref:Uncharacterized protein n=1 Tax=Sporosarcina newyorkensis TaxID=759851 RepID=A0A1T4Y1J8_9BACL|nr:MULTISPECIES: hypothetical protein [Sporosarcina]MBY0223497.1 hypothetical protein [Sporosarcina aquimarina]SKA95646.1 hypothetical protein SAMN04244570_1681 [Sporosarcina newyorkensis]